MSCRFPRFFAVIIGIVVLSVSTVPLYAQYTTASLGGTVTDETGAVLPGAQVTVSNVDTAFTENTLTDDRGNYLFPRLPVGQYQLTVEMPGFRSYVQSGITLAVNQAATQNVTLQVGEIGEQVTVQASAELLETRTATGGQLVDERRIVDLPLEGRRPERLIYLAAGTVDLGRDSCRICGHGGVYPGEETAGVNGAGIAQVNFQLDGTGHNDTYLNASLPFPNPDSVQEFNLASSNFSAEYGMAGGGVVNIVTKAGTNEVHGTLFHFHRNGALNSRQFFAPEADSLIRNQFGGSVGGPILKDKLFFFGTYQGTRIRETPGGIIQFVPTAAQRQGDFSDLSEQLIDPLTQDPFPNNQIPSSRISPVARYLMDWIPLPNEADGQLTFTGTPIAQDEDQFMTKFDFNTERHQISGRYFFTDFDAPPAIPEDNILAASSAGNAVRVQNISINHTYAASPSFLLNTTFGRNIQRGGSLSSAPFSMADAGANILGPEDVGELNAPPEIVLTVSGFFSVRTNHLGDFDRGDYTFREVATKTLGSHELRFGGEAVRVENDIVNTFQMAGQFTFSGELSGNALADFLLGRLSTFRQGGGEFKELRGTRWGFFIQDNWRTTPRLSLNVGLRWDPYLPPYDRQGRVVCFQPLSGQRSQRYPNAPVGMLYGGENNDPGCPTAGSETNWWNFAPRLGLAYRLTADGKTTLRSGFGLYYTPIQTSNFNPFTNIAPFAGTFTLNGVAVEDPYGSAGMENPFPSNFGPDVPGPEFEFAEINDIRAYFAPDYRIPQLATWSLRLERQVGENWVASAAYLGNKGTYLQVTMEENPAMFIPGVDADGNFLSTVGNTQERRIYPNFGPVGRTDSGSNSHYHALQLNLEKRFARGLSILTNYTWSKTTDDITGANPFDRRSGYGLADQDVTHNFKFSNIFEIPRLDVAGFTDKLLNGWQLNSSIVWQSGFPFTITSGQDNSLTGVGGQRADFLGGDPELSSDRPRGEKVLQWFDTSRFAVPERGTFGNVGRNTLRGPQYFNVDFGVLKTSRLTETVGLQFRAEFFNLFNNVNFRLPSTNVSSSQFGRITSVVDDSQRIIQFGLKLVF